MPGRAQDRERDAVARRPRAQAILGGDAAARARRLRPARTRFGDARAGAVAVDAGRRNVDEALWYTSRPRQRRDQLLRARIVAAGRRRRREMQHREGRRAQATERSRRSSRSPTIGTMPWARSLGNVVGAAREAVETDLRTKQVGGAQRDVAAADQQYPDHARLSLSRGTRAARKCLSTNLADATPDYHKAQRSLVRLPRTATPCSRRRWRPI